MLLKPRTPSMELKILRSLNSRMSLSPDERMHYWKLEKGYQGEVMFDQLTVNLQSDKFVINDLCLPNNNSFFQIDTLIISQETIYPFEIKNFEGDYYFDSNSESDGFYTMKKEEIQNPLVQLKRIKLLLGPLLKNLGFHVPIDGYVPFVNPKFTLYQAPLDKPIIFPTQLDNFIKKFNQIPSRLSGKHRKLADQLISMHLTETPYSRTIQYQFRPLKKGVLCSTCFSFMYFDNGGKLVCGKCGCEEDVVIGVIRSVEEIKLLFPDLKITTNLVHEWCGVIGSRKMIRRILTKNMKVIGYGRWFYYE
ncbi:nuclease-related domain-containing protein [Neobacillus pocheonensis]|uniref:nuclease-related domain-containing protein n=1 Tax=Neobacillus pocheonensis TaxID=363869 RepID=UPI003D298B72